MNSAFAAQAFDRPAHLQLARTAGAAEAFDVAARMEIDLAPDAHRVERHGDLVQSLPGAARAPEFVVGRMRADHRIEVGFLHARRGAVRRKAVDDAVLVPPVAGNELARDAAGVAGGAVGIVEAVVGAEARERRRLHDAHPPLRHAEVRLADAADLAVRPRLCRDPLDHVVEVALLVRAEELEVAARLPRAAHVHMDVRVALLDVELDRPGLAPEKLRAGGKRVVVVAVGRCGEERRETAAPFGRVDGDADLSAVANGDRCFFHHGLFALAIACQTRLGE